MTAPQLPLEPPRDFENITTREILSYKRTGDNGTDPGAGAGPNAVTVPLPILDGDGVEVILAPPAGNFDPDWPIPRFDAKGQHQIRCIADVEDPGAAGSRAFVEHSELGASWETPGVGAVSVEVTIDVAGSNPGPNEGWVDLSVEAAADRLWRGLLSGGDGVTSPGLRKFHAQFRQKAVTRPPRPTTPPGDLPEDGTWGDIIWDLNVDGPMFAALGLADGDDVELWPDETGNGHDFVTLSSLLRPKYRAAGFGGTLPCVEWDGGNLRMFCPTNPTGGLGEYTYYFVLDNLDGGGDNARLFGAGMYDSFQHAIYASGNQILCANNNLFGSPSIIVTDDWSMLAKNIYRWFKTPTSASHSLHVNGDWKANAGAAPQANNGGDSYLMDFMTGIGMTARVARIVAYNKRHYSPTNIDPPATGMTLPETILQARWGTQ